MAKGTRKGWKNTTSNRKASSRVKAKMQRTANFAASRSRLGNVSTAVARAFGEKKAVDIKAAPITTTITATGANFVLLNGVQTGQSFYNRETRKIAMKSLHFNGTINPTGNGNGLPEYNRIMIVYDRQPNGAFPAIADLLLDYANDGTTTTTSFSNINMTNADRFKVLMDVRHALPDNNFNAGVAEKNGTASMVDYGQETKINRFINLKGLETVYKGSSNPAAIGDQTVGSLFLVTFGSILNGNNPGTQLSWNSRLRFYESR